MSAATYQLGDVVTVRTIDGSIQRLRVLAQLADRFGPPGFYGEDPDDPRRAVWSYDHEVLSVEGVRCPECDGLCNLSLQREGGEEWGKMICPTNECDRVIVAAFRVAMYHREAS